MDEKDWFDPWPLMNFSPVSFWIHSNVMVNEQIKVWLAVFGRLGQQLALHK